MSMTTIVGAFLALVPGRPKPEPEKKSREKTLTALTLELEGYISELERELAAERNLSTHWIGEAARLARENREQRACQPQQDPRQALEQAMAQQQAAWAQQQAETRAFYDQVAYAQQAQQNHLSQLGEPLQQSGLWCNCVPSRAQVWGAQHGLVQQLNDNGRE
jgi:hypothetical protein